MNSELIAIFNAIENTKKGTPQYKLLEKAYRLSIAQNTYQSTVTNL